MISYRERERAREIAYSAGVDMAKEAEEKEVWTGVLLDKAQYVNK